MQLLLCRRLKVHERKAADPSCLGKSIKERPVSTKLATPWNGTLNCCFFFLTEIANRPIAWQRLNAFRPEEVTTCQKFKASLRMEKKEDWGDFERGANDHVQSRWDFHDITTISGVYRRESAKKTRYPASGRCVEENASLTSGVGSLSFCFGLLCCRRRARQAHICLRIQVHERRPGSAGGQNGQTGWKEQELKYPPVATNRNTPS